MATSGDIALVDEDQNKSMSEDSQLGQDLGQKSPSVQKIYANGFNVQVTGSDIVIHFSRDGQPEAQLNVSFTLAKTLGAAIGNTVTVLENISGKKFLTTHELDQLISDKLGKPEKI